MLKASIVGLPNVGKSTLFNAITKSNILAANYPFATIEPNIGSVLVKDERLDFLKSLYNPKKTTYAICEFQDVAGLVKGASKGEGLGNQFLSHIRNSDLIIQVVRCFSDSNIIHVDGSYNPLRDFNTINIELILSDLEIVTKRLEKLYKKYLAKVPDIIFEYELLKKIETSLLNEIPIRCLDFSDEENLFLSNFGFITKKDMLVVINVDIEELSNINENSFFQEIKKELDKNKIEYIVLSCQFESELSLLDEDIKEEFLKEYNLKETGLDTLIKKTYKMLGYQTFFTTGEDECRAWTFISGSKAPKCAGIIHSDFEKGFIKAEVLSFSDLKNESSYTKAKEKGLVRLEGKEYVVKDGDIILFKFNV